MTLLEREDMQSLLVRIDERVKAIQEDIREINEVRQCASHDVKIRSLERIAWGCMAGLAAMGSKLVFEAFK